MSRRSVNRSAISGKFISKAAAARHPKTTVRDSVGGRSGTRSVNRSAISGKFIGKAAAARHPKTTVTEKV